ncbi:MAG: RNA polymerase sigma factor [Gemmatales bacterium]|nr:RNA polymerase sigma factor [Gemmatales bacterium]MDW8385937.1 RNA polymerase sigma factor [Gemmatales bacterium]
MAERRWKGKYAVSDPDVQLMLRVRNGDAAAFHELLQRYRDKVYQQIYLRITHREEAEDLTQEVFLRVYRHRKRYKPTAKFVTWLFHIVRNVARNHLRDRRRRPLCRLLAVNADGELAELDALVSDPRSEGPTAPIEKSETCRLVRDALDRLHFRHRLALEMQQYEDQSYGAIARTLALTPQAAKSLLYRARNQLRLELAPHMLPD